MNTISLAAASVIGSRHTRAARNGQDAVATWSGLSGHRPGYSDKGRTQLSQPRVRPLKADGAVAASVVVVSDGCSSGASSEVGARLGAGLFARAVGARLEAGESPCDPAMWADARAEVVAQLGALAEQMAGQSEDRLGIEGEFAEIVHEHFLFTLVAAAVRGDEAAVWAVGDGVYSFGDYTRELGPFADNAPPYLGYDLLGDGRPAHFEIAAPHCGSIIIGTDGAVEILGGIEKFAGRRYVDHPDVLRRELALLAKPAERIDWDERRVIRTPAALQDDCAIAVLRWEPAAATASWSVVGVEACS